MDKSKILLQLKAIQSKISDNTIGAWEHDLEGTTDVVILNNFNENSKIDDAPVTMYNGWAEDLNKIIFELEKE